MPRSESDNEYTYPEEFYSTAPEHSESVEFSPADNEFVPREAEESQRRDTAAHEARKKQRLKRNLLLQAAAVMVTVVLVTSSFGEDILRGGSESDTLTEMLEESGAGRGKVSVSMIWNTADDVDLHVVTPSGSEISYEYPTGPGGGELDVDMQVSTIVDHPIENIFFTDPEQGEYRVYIVNYSDRDPGDPEVLVRVTILGKKKEYRVTLDGYSKEVCIFKYGK